MSSHQDIADCWCVWPYMLTVGVVQLSEQ
jgi:hypothetical protein